MKKSNLFVGILYAVIGILLLLTAFFFNTKLDSLLYSFSGACIASGIMMIYKYFYWNLPKNKDRYIERMENETINLHDERKENFRNKSGRYAYLLGLLVISVSIVVFTILGTLDIISYSRPIVLYLGGYFIFQFIIGIVIFQYLDKKY